MCLLAFSEPGWSSHSSYKDLTRGFSKGSFTKIYMSRKKKKLLNYGKIKTSVVHKDRTGKACA
jgi:hypothetical protein